MQHRHRGGRRRVAVRRPRVQRPDAGEDPEPDIEGQEHPRLQRRVELLRGKVRKENDCDPARDEQRQDADEDEGRPEQQVQRQLHRRVLFRANAGSTERPAEDPLRPHFSRRTPDADEQVHRQHGDLVEQEEDEQVERDEDAVDAGDQDQQQRVELLAPLLRSSTTRRRPRR